MTRSEMLLQRLGELRVLVLVTDQRERLAEKLAREDCDLTDLGVLAAWFEDEAERRGGRFGEAADWRGGLVKLLREPNAKWREVVEALNLNPAGGGKAEASYRGDGGVFRGGGSSTCMHGFPPTESCDACDPFAVEQRAKDKKRPKPDKPRVGLAVIPEMAVRDKAAVSAPAAKPKRARKDSVAKPVKAGSGDDWVGEVYG